MRTIIKKIIREIFSDFVYYLGILSIYRYFAKKKITILNYHDINSKDFERHIKYLIKHFKIITLDECANILKEDKDKNDYIVITFDDGYESFYSEIYPVLKKYDIPATVFLATDFVGSRKLYWFDMIRICFEEDRIESFKRYLKNRNINVYSVINYFNQIGEDEKLEKVLEVLEEETINFYNKTSKKYHILDWKQIKEMREDIVCFGAHTMSHPILTKISLEKAREEIFGSKKNIEEQIGKKIKHFAYPNGDLSDFNNDIISILKEGGFLCALTTIDGNCIVGDDLFRLKRKVVDGGFSIPSLAAKIIGLWIPLGRKGI